MYVTPKQKKTLSWGRLMESLIISREIKDGSPTWIKVGSLPQKSGNKARCMSTPVFLFPDGRFCLAKQNIILSENTDHGRKVSFVSEFVRKPPLLFEAC